MYNDKLIKLLGYRKPHDLDLWSVTQVELDMIAKDEHEDADDIYDQCDNNDIDEATEYEHEHDDIGDNEAHEHEDIGDNETHDDTGGAIKYDQKML